MLGCPFQALKKVWLGSAKVSTIPAPPPFPGAGVAGDTLMPSRRLALFDRVLVMLYVQLSPIWRLRCAIWFEPYAGGSTGCPGWMVTGGSVSPLAATAAIRYLCPLPGGVQGNGPRIAVPKAGTTFAPDAPNVAYWPEPAPAV